MISSNTQSRIDFFESELLSIPRTLFLSINTTTSTTTKHIWSWKQAHFKKVRAYKKRWLFGFDQSLLIFLLLFAFLQAVAVAVVVVVVVIDVGEERLAENPGLETLDGKVDVVARGVERDLPLQRWGSLLQINDVSPGQSHAQLGRLVRRRTLDLFFLAHGDEFFKDFWEESDLLSTAKLLQHRLQEHLLVIRRIHENGLVEDIAVVVFAGNGGFLYVAHRAARSRAKRVLQRARRLTN